MKAERREITFRRLCLECRSNGANHQEYMRLCPPREQCLLTRGKKQAKSCPIWKRLKKVKEQ